MIPPNLARLQAYARFLEEQVNALLIEKIKDGRLGLHVLVPQEEGGGYVDLSINGDPEDEDWPRVYSVSTYYSAEPFYEETRSPRHAVRSLYRQTGGAIVASDLDPPAAETDPKKET